MSQLTDSFVNRVQQPGGGTVSATEFFAQIDEPAPSQLSDEFDPGLLTDMAVMRSSARVVDDLRMNVSNGIGTICVATQFSDAIPIDFLRGVDGAGGPSSMSAGADYSAPTPGEGFNI